ncbi:DUF4249 domain-containing protein [Allomuricauda sp. d1]|uniref:DUF4249 domain-containing protein n=1 Tax=Allomuricauda sp. d1 TaxID=3136725 RepID=UPI0031E1DBFB
MQKRTATILNGSTFVKRALLFIAFLNLYGCVEEFQAESIAFESILVVEAMLTDEFKKHEIILSTTTPIENDSIAPERGASVSITDSNQRQYLFEEIEDGKYVSIEEFNAEDGVDYQLDITTADGRSYQSNEKRITATGQVDEVTARRVVNENGTDGVEILATGSGNGEGPFFFRYEFEETYQVIAPFATSRIDLVIVSENPPVLETVPKMQEERVCYSSGVSNSIILSSTNNLIGDGVTNTPVHFIPNDNPILRFRYSILVKQFVQSREIQAFYETLSTISDLDNLFAQIQPGFVEGNISSTSDPNQKVLGFFEVASVSSKRIFFNYRDIFPDVDFPRYFEDCVFREFPIMPVGEEFEELKVLLGLGYRLVAINEGFFNNAVSYEIVSPACGNCNNLGTNVVPDFWEE